MNETNRLKALTAKNLSVKILLYLILTIAAFFTLFPYVWMILTSFKDTLEAMSTEFRFFPEKFLVKGYSDLAAVEPSFARSFLNTIILEIAVIPIGTTVSALSAFAFAKMRLPNKRFFLFYLMSGMMVPYAALLLPQYRAYSELGLTGSLYPLVFPGWFGNVSMMFFFIQYLKSTPNAVIEAGRMDGAGWLKSFFVIVAPLIVPAIAAQVVFWFLGIWNDYFAPSIYLSGSDWLTVQALLALINDNNSRRANLPLVMAGATVSSIPIILIYIIFQKYFVQSLALSGVKE